MLTIVTSNQVPDSTYFTTRSVEPDLEGNQLTMYNGTGRRRSTWGEPGVTSTVLFQDDVLVAVHTGFFHKHGGGQFWRYYRTTPDGWAQVLWKSLSDDERQVLLTAYEHRAAHLAWMKSPGKLRSEYQKPTLTTKESYKIVRVVDGRYYSVYDPGTEYVLGQRLAQKAQWDHAGGYYSYPSPQGVERRFADRELFPDRCYEQDMTLALLRCEISGTILEYGRKYSSTYLRPLEVMRTLTYSPTEEKSNI